MEFKINEKINDEVPLMKKILNQKLNIMIEKEE